MNKRLEAFLRRELYFELQEIWDNSSKYKELLMWIVEAIRKKKPVRKIKDRIKHTSIDQGIAKRLSEFIVGQWKIITGEDRGFSLDKESAFGTTFREALTNRKLAVKKSAQRFMVLARNQFLDKAEVGETRKTIEVEVERYKKANEGFWRTQAKAGREYAYQREEYLQGKKKPTKLKGWISKAVLDNRTSAICAGLHNQFYAFKEYGFRDQIPNRPPRHENCRSVLIEVYEDETIKEFRGETLGDFLKANPEDARAFMGQKKYNLWKANKLKVEKFIDIKGARFFTNKEIEQRLAQKNT